MSDYSDLITADGIVLAVAAGCGFWIVVALIAGWL